MPNSTTRENQHEQNSSFLQRRFASQPTSDIDFNNKTRSTNWGRTTGYGRGRLGPRNSNHGACWEIDATKCKVSGGTSFLQIWNS